MLEKILKLNLVQTAIEIAKDLNVELFLVGGVVRDLLLGKEKFKDFDFLISDLLSFFTAEFADRLGEEKVILREKFLTATIGDNIDVSEFRREKYEQIAVLPMVEKADCVEEDLARRDFTINAMALMLWPEFKLIDPFEGREDLKNKLIRVLHSESFRDDPTRIYRAFRYKNRYNFKFEDKTYIWMIKGRKYLNYLTSSRIRNELNLILQENKRALFELSEEKMLLGFDYVVNENYVNFDLLEKVEKLDEILLAYFWNARLTNEEVKKLSRIFDFRKSELQLLEDIELIKFIAEEEDLSTAYIYWKKLNRESKQFLTKYYKIGKDIQDRLNLVKLNGNDLIRLGIKNKLMIGKLLDRLREELMSKILTKSEQERLVKQWMES